MTTLHPVAFVCPRCRQVFVSSVLGSYGQVGSHTDLCPRFTGANPLPCFLHRCSGCGFIAYQDEFGEGEPRGSGFDHGFAELYPSESGVVRYTDAAAYYESRGADQETVGWLYLRAAWCARYEQRGDDEQRMLAEAARWFAAALAEGAVEPAEQAQTTYLVGELHRRCGEFTSALEYFGRARALPAEGEATEWLPGLIARQHAMAEARDAAPAELPPRPKPAAAASPKGWLARLRRLAGG